jgi:N-acetylglucosamine-6-phosphate deacetylase
LGAPVETSGASSAFGPSDIHVIDAAGLYAIPGLIDLHTHGCVGEDYALSDPDGIRKMLSYQAANGVTGICATTMTLSEEMLTQAVANIRRCATTMTLPDETPTLAVTNTRHCAAPGAPDDACPPAQDVQSAPARHFPAQDAQTGLERHFHAQDAPSGHAHILGIHLEGPFVSPHKLGAQNPAYQHNPDPGMFQRLQNASGGMVKLLAMAPELPGGMDCIKELSPHVRISLAHTTADYGTAAAAFDCGAREVTHLYNAMPPFSHREPGVVGAALDDHRVMVELICDGVHIHPAVVRATLGMFGEDRVIFISDSMMATGLGDGMYSLGALPVEVKGKKAVLAQGAGQSSIAGSVCNLMMNLRTAVNEMHIPLHVAVKCATANPARALGISDRYGAVEPGKAAHLVLLDQNLDIKQVFVDGMPMSAALSSNQEKKSLQIPPATS